MDRTTKDRAAKNEALFRDVNERVKEVDERQPDAGAAVDTLWDFLCECADGSCTQAVAMTASEYEEVRANPLYFAVIPGHEISDIERVVIETERYVVVEKVPGERTIALDTDPRA